MSKGLECLERMAMPDEVFLKECERLNIDNHSDYEYLKKELKALEIIKNKQVDIELLLECFWVAHMVKRYNNSIKETRKFLTQEEYVLLREVLCNDI